MKIGYYVLQEVIKDTGKDNYVGKYKSSIFLVYKIYVWFITFFYTI